MYNERFTIRAREVQTKRFEKKKKGDKNFRSMNVNHPRRERHVVRSSGLRGKTAPTKKGRQTLLSTRLVRQSHSHHFPIPLPLASFSPIPRSNDDQVLRFYIPARQKKNRPDSPTNPPLHTSSSYRSTQQRNPTRHQRSRPNRFNTLRAYRRQHSSRLCTSCSFSFSCSSPKQPKPHNQT
ncbi:hypothetical protein K435DRAFT_462222 [Dendrothele bispora CBS 962.96]|uniref:Uncharacterized protein n=1 Tax=Dendrothele bispora (strain CBS 962.96) TaxID=1314807 RepID=A0A4S8MCQ9_DENBC|nr:hypothetical protein K435DRAFT_462222 [Dendrothele bispora CBS 962.96]